MKNRFESMIYGGVRIATVGALLSGCASLGLHDEEEVVIQRYSFQQGELFAMQWWEDNGSSLLVVTSGEEMKVIAETSEETMVVAEAQCASTDRLAMSVGGAPDSLGDIAVGSTSEVMTANICQDMTIAPDEASSLVAYSFKD